jgi:phytoene dehydrogenase-like protein
MPERPFVLVCQQYLADPSRSASNLNPLYAYAHVPNGYPGDATEAIERQIERFAPGFRERVQRRVARTVAEAEKYDANYIDGDVVGGANDLRQLLFRPRPARDPYALGIPGVYLCSASTPPGARGPRDVRVQGGEFCAPRASRPLTRRTGNPHPTVRS